MNTLQAEDKLITLLEGEHKLLLDEFSSTNPGDALVEEISSFRALCQAVDEYAKANDFVKLGDWAAHRDAYWSRRQYADVQEVQPLSEEQIEEARARVRHLTRSRNEEWSLAEFVEVGKSNLESVFETNKAIAEVWLEFQQNMLVWGTHAWKAYADAKSQDEIIAIQRGLVQRSVRSVLEGLRETNAHTSKMAEELIENSEAMVKLFANGALREEEQEVSQELDYGEAPLGTKASDLEEEEHKFIHRRSKVA